MDLSVTDVRNRREAAAAGVPGAGAGGGGKRQVNQPSRARISCKFECAKLPHLRSSWRRVIEQTKLFAARVLFSRACNATVRGMFGEESQSAYPCPSFPRTLVFRACLRQRDWPLLSFHVTRQRVTRICELPLAKMHLHARRASRPNIPDNDERDANGRCTLAKADSRRT